jgi:hypothetical protein
LRLRGLVLDRNAAQDFDQAVGFVERVIETVGLG